MIPFWLYETRRDSFTLCFLTGVEENYKHQWAREMNELFTEMKKYIDERKKQLKELDLEQIKAL